MAVDSELAPPNINYSVEAFEVISDESLRKRSGLKPQMFRMEEMDVLRASQTKM